MTTTDSTFDGKRRTSREEVRTSDHGETSRSAQPPVSVWLEGLTSVRKLPADPEFRQIIVAHHDDYGQPTAAQWSALAQYMSQHPRLQLFLKFFGNDLHDLDFLVEFEWLTALTVECAALQSIQGVRHLQKLHLLDLGPTNRRVSLQMLAELPELTSLSITDHSRDLDIIGQIPTLRSVSLTSVKRTDLEFLTGAEQLASVSTTRGRIDDLSALTRLPNLLALFIYRTKVADLMPIGDCTGLVSLWLETLPVANVPDLGLLHELVAVEVANLKGLDGLAHIAHAPQLRYLRVQSDSLQPHDFTSLAGHPTLEVIDADLKSDKSSYQVNQMLDLPRDAGKPDTKAELRHQLAARIGGGA